MLQADLKILGGKHQGKLIALNTKKFLVGREQDCHLRPNSDLVSRHHCVFLVDDYAIRLRDLGSTNGTLVNGTCLRGEVILKAGDRVTIGKLELEVVIRSMTGKKPPSSSELPTSAAEKSDAVLSTAEISTKAEETETSYELKTPDAVNANPTPVEIPEQSVPVVAQEDTAIIGAVPTQFPQPLAMGYPPGYPQMMPPGYPMPGGYMPPQYPQYPPGYGQAYGQPMGYPPMGYPQMMPMQGYPTASVAAPPAAPVQEVTQSPADTEMPVRLPDPAETGAQPVVPPNATAGAAKKEEKPSTTAADIIKQYMSRRS